MGSRRDLHECRHRGRPRAWSGPRPLQDSAGGGDRIPHRDDDGPPGSRFVLSAHSISLGGGLVRNYVHTLFRAPGGSLTLNGLYMTAGNQQADNYTRIDHVAPSCTSVELYRGILDGRSRGVFNGNIYVRKDAQKTVARQTNKNLLLSKEAFVDSKPGLEILADDVKCNHVSTIGKLDDNAVFYL